jgi:hypothetical protein
MTVSTTTPGRRPMPPAHPVPGTLHVYGITPAGVRTPRAPGVGGESVRLLTEAGLAAAVSAAPADSRARRRDLAAHQSVLAELGAHGPVLPMRFAVLAGDEAALRDHMRRRRAHIQEQFDTVRDCVEMNVRGEPAPDCLTELVRGDPALCALARTARDRPGYETSLRLGEAVAKAAGTEARRAAREVLSRLAPLARRTAQGTVDGSLVLSTSFLLPAAGEKKFRAVLAGQVRRHAGRLSLSVTGPLPCYSFVDPGTAAAPSGSARTRASAPTRAPGRSR